MALLLGRELLLALLRKGGSASRLLLIEVGLTAAWWKPRAGELLLLLLRLLLIYGREASRLNLLVLLRQHLEGVYIVSLIIPHTYLWDSFYPTITNKYRG